MPEKPTEEAFYLQVLKAVGAPLMLSPRRHMLSVRETTFRILRELGTRMLMIDEINSILVGSPRPKPLARRAMARPTRPRPKMPSRLPLAVRLSLAPLSGHLLSRTKRSLTAMRRVTASRSPIAVSATSSVSTPGVVVTRMPRARAPDRRHRCRCR